MAVASETAVEPVRDISALSNLTSLEGLVFWENNVRDISALVENEGLGSNDRIDMRENYLDLTPGSENMQDIETLLDRGVVVDYEPQREPVVDYEPQREPQE